MQIFWPGETVYDLGATLNIRSSITLNNPPLYILRRHPSLSHPTYVAYQAALVSRQRRRSSNCLAWNQLSPIKSLTFNKNDL